LTCNGGKARVEQLSKLEGGGPGQLPMSIWQAPDGEVGQQVRQVLTLSECRDCGRMGTLA
jgi:hypothetical protein